MIEFFIEGRPVPWARTNTNQGRRITPKKQREHKELIAELAALKAKKVPAYESEPLLLMVTFAYKTPKKQTKRKPTARPDIDNLVKQIMDGLNGVAYTDDSQVVNVVANKIYAEHSYTKVMVYAI